MHHILWHRNSGCRALQTAGMLLVVWLGVGNLCVQHRQQQRGCRGIVGGQSDSVSLAGGSCWVSGWLARAYGAVLVAVKVQCTHCAHAMHAVGLQAGHRSMYLQPGNQAGRFLVCSYQQFNLVTCLTSSCELLKLVRIGKRMIGRTCRAAACRFSCLGHSQECADTLSKHLNPNKSISRKTKAM